MKFGFNVKKDGKEIFLGNFVLFRRLEVFLV